MTRKPRVRDVTPMEDEAIKRGIAADPDAHELPETALAISRPKPRRGRPVGRTKSQVTINVDNDVLDKLKSPTAKGWQTRLNATLRGALNLRKH